MNNGKSEECSFNTLICEKKHEPGFTIILTDPNSDSIIGIRYKSSDNQSNESLNFTVSLKKKDGSPPPHASAVECRHLAAIQLKRMKNTGTCELKCLQTREEIQQIRDKIDLEELTRNTQPVPREIIASEHIGQYLYKLHEEGKGNRTCVYISTGNHALAVCIDEFDKYIVIVSYDPNYAFLNNLVLKEKHDIKKIDLKMLFYNDISQYRIIKSRVCMDKQYRADMITIIEELEKLARVIYAPCRDHDPQGNANIQIGKLLWCTLFVICNTDRYDHKEHLQLINKIEENPVIWDNIKKKVFERINSSTSYYEIVTLLSARDLLIREYCNQIKIKLRNLTCDSESLSAAEEMLTCNIVTAGQIGIFKIPFAILCVLDNRIARMPRLYSTLEYFTYLIIINAILLPIESSARKQPPYNIVKYYILAFIANSVCAAIITPILICAFRKHMYGQMPYSYNFKNEQLRAIKEKQAESKSSQTGSASRTMEAPLLISVDSNYIGNNPNTQGTGLYSAKDGTREHINTQPYNTSICSIL